jgi:hypothetical protein
VLKVVGDEEGRLWLASPAGLFCWENGAWRAVRRGVSFWRVNTVAVNGRHLWLAGMPGGILRSANGGQAWHRCWIEQTEAPVVAIAPSPHFAQDRVLLAATDGDGVLRSTDGGRHWELANFGLREFAVLDVVMAPRIGGYEYAFAITENGFYQSPNGGRAWRLVEMGEIQPIVLAVSPNFVEDRMVCLGTEAGELFVSTDAGLSWTCLGDEFDGVNALAFTADQILLVGTETTIYHVLPGSPFALQMARFAELPAPILSLAAVNGAVYAGLVDGLWLSQDNGRSWQPDTNLAARRFVWYCNQTANHWLAAGPEEGVWRVAGEEERRAKSEGRGAREEERRARGEERGARGEWLVIWDEVPVLGVAATEREIWISTLEGLVVSADEGQSWQVAWESEEPLTALAVVNDVVWAGSGAGRVWRRVKGEERGAKSEGRRAKSEERRVKGEGVRGEWEEVVGPFAGGQLVGFVADGGMLLAVVWSAANNLLQLWRWDEGGEWAVWFSQPAGAVLPQVAVSEGRAIVGLGSFVYRLTETGWQRQRVTSVDAPVTAVCALPGGGWLAAVTDGLWQSADGVTWTAVENGLSGEPVVSLAVVGGNVVAGTAEGKVWVASSQ